MKVPTVAQKSSKILVTIAPSFQEAWQGAQIKG